MLKISSDPVRHALNGPPMGTRWSALFHAPEGVDPAPIRAALQAAVDDVDAQISTGSPGSDLMRLNAARPGDWLAAPAGLIEVQRLGMEIGRASGGAFDIGMGDAVTAWGSGPDAAAPDRIRAAMAVRRIPAHEALQIDGDRVRETAPLALDLNAIAKGYGMDRLADTLAAFSIDDGLVGIDGEMRASGLRPDAAPWTIAIEAPDPTRRARHSVLTLEDAAVATSGDYRHWVEVRGRRLSHTMDPACGAPAASAPALVTVVAATCAEADGWATALAVLGEDRGAALADARAMNALFLLREADGAVRSVAVGALFGDDAR
ncbi:MAG: thiamine biosynthesis lipoprotein [Paracoccaceae bacterium]|jgi:thiamine biosynthesis lipoprotein